MVDMLHMCDGKLISIGGLPTIAGELVDCCAECCSATTECDCSSSSGAPTPASLARRKTRRARSAKRGARSRERYYLVRANYADLEGDRKIISALECIDHAEYKMGTAGEEYMHNDKKHFWSVKYVDGPFSDLLVCWDSLEALDSLPNTDIIVEEQTNDE